MNDILATLFLENPYIPERIFKFCDQLPEFRAAEQAYQQETAKLRTQLGEAAYGAWEEAFNWHLAQYAHAYYLFGLGLRQEVLSALGG